METPLPSDQVTSALEDYLETIYELAREHGYARVRDIAEARGVKAGSVSPAMKRLAELGLIDYAQREYLTLTPEGEITARRVTARHDLLRRLLEDVLQLPASVARADACSMEHALSDMTMERLVRFFEYLAVCDEGKRLVSLFQECRFVQGADRPCRKNCSDACGHGDPLVSASRLKDGQKAKVAKVNGKGAIRQRLLDMGLLPGAAIQFERAAPAGGPVWIRLQGYQLLLRRKEADLVMVSEVT